jgi:hypothetical protein
VVFCTGCKLVQVYTGARYMVLAGEHPMEAWAQLPGPRGWFPIFLGGLSIICFPFWLGALSLMLGGALNWIFGLDARPELFQQLSAQLFGSGFLLMAAALTLWQSYRTLEIVQTLIIGLLLAGILLVQTFPAILLAGICLFAVTTIFSFITLPVEINASNRALAWIRNSGVTNFETHEKAEDALRWAGYTYVIAALGSLATLLYYVMIYLGRRD